MIKSIRFTFIRYSDLTVKLTSSSQLYKAKLEQQTNYINRIVTLSRTLGTTFFSPDMMDLCAAEGEDSSDILSLRDVTPERFSKLDKEFYRGKAEIVRYEVICDETAR